VQRQPPFQVAAKPDNPPERERKIAFKDTYNPTMNKTK